MLEINQPEKSIDPKEKSYIDYDDALDNFQGNVVWRAAHALLDHQDFDSSPLWISKSLGITVEEAVEALEGLRVLGLVAKTENGYEKRKIQFLVPEERTKLDSQIKSHVNLSQQLLNRLNKETKSRYQEGFVASNKDIVLEFDRKIREAFYDMLDKSTEKSKDGIYGFSMTIVDLLNQDVQGAN